MEVHAWELDGRDVVHVYGVAIIWGGGGGEVYEGSRLEMRHWGQ